MSDHVCGPYCVWFESIQEGFARSRKFYADLVDLDFAPLAGPLNPIQLELIARGLVDVSAYDPPTIVRGYN